MSHLPFVATLPPDLMMTHIRFAGDQQFQQGERSRRFNRNGMAQCDNADAMCDNADAMLDAVILRPEVTQ